MIMQYFKDHDGIEVALVVSNRKAAGVFARADRFGVPTVYLPKATWSDAERVLGVLREYRIDFIALAGFLLLVPAYLVDAFPQRIVNIHPALLPKHGGKGMYGINVHRAVKAAGDVVSGPTIHYVDRAYDEGNIIFQIKTALVSTDTPEEIARKVLKLEHYYYPRVIEKVLA